MRVMYKRLTTTIDKLSFKVEFSIINMLKLQYSLAIGFVLLALQARDSSGQIHQGRYNFFRTCVSSFLGPSTLIRSGSVSIRAESVDRLDQLSPAFNDGCIIIFQAKMVEANIWYPNYESENVENDAKLNRLAFESLDLKCKNTFEYIVKQCTSRDEKILNELNWILYKGDVLHFLEISYELNPSQTELNAEIEKLQKVNLKITTYEAKIRIAVREFNKVSGRHL